MAQAKREGVQPMQWLWEDWQANTNRFSKSGEAFYIARVDTRLVGVCRVNRVPSMKNSRTARLRRLYLHPSLRRPGIGCQLVQHAMDEMKEKFSDIHLRTMDEGYALFFEKLGFANVTNQEERTHTFSF